MKHSWPDELIDVVPMPQPDPDFGPFAFVTAGATHCARCGKSRHEARGTECSTFAADQDARCRFCHRYVTDGLYTRVSFPDGIANVCDICREKADEPDDYATWQDTEVEVV